MTGLKGAQGLRQALQQYWTALAPREQHGLRWAAGVLGLALVWWLLVAPAWRTVQRAPQQHAALDATLQQMQSLQLRAQELRARAPVSAQAMQKALETSSLVMGPAARWQFSEGQAVLSLNAAPAAQLAEWLATAAALAPAPAEAQLRRQGAGTGVVWSGTLLFRVPPSAP